MIDISTLEVSGFKGAILGMRNPFKNRDKSDSQFSAITGAEIPEIAFIGEKDLELAQKLIRAGGDDDAKFMRMIHVQADVNAPLYWWKEYDTYKVSTVANSESTMHTIMKYPFTLGDFSIDEECKSALYWTTTVGTLNAYRDGYLEAKEKGDTAQMKAFWRQMIQALPNAYMQKRTIDLNYQTLRRIYFARKNHKLIEWHEFCIWIHSLPYAKELITYDPSDMT